MEPSALNMSSVLQLSHHGAETTAEDEEESLFYAEVVDVCCYIVFVRYVRQGCHINELTASMSAYKPYTR